MRTRATCTRGHALTAWANSPAAQLVVNCGYTGSCDQMVPADLGYPVSIALDGTVWRAAEVTVTHADGYVSVHGGTDVHEALDSAAYDIEPGDYTATVTLPDGQTFTGEFATAGDDQRRPYVITDPYTANLLAA